jgi:hypothetical protein
MGDVMKIQVEISKKSIEYILSSGFAGANYWIDYERSEIPEGPLSNDWPRFVANGGTVKIATLEDDKKGKYALNLKSIQRGLTKMANAPSDKGGHHFKDVTGDFDMETGDAVIQFALFGKLIYG